MLASNELHAKLPASIRNIISNLGWRDFKPVQLKSFNAVVQGKNTLIVAPTAGGKTEAALLPVLANILNKDFSEKSVRCIYVAPLKALLNDMESRLENYCNDATGLRFFKWHGDVLRSKKLNFKKEVPEILITTPESLEVMFISQFFEHKEHFSELDSIIIDEAHGFAGTARGAQLTSLIARIENISDKEVQRIALSATIGDPEAVLTWMSGNSHLLGEIVHVEKEKNAKNKYNIFIHYFDETEEGNNKYLATLKQHCQSKTIIFNNSRKGAEILAKETEGMGIKTTVHHGSLSKNLREEAEYEMKDKDIPRQVISTTCTLELGIDIGDLDTVIQIGRIPSTNSYLQRRGRAARRKNTIGNIVVLTEEPDDFLLSLAIIIAGEKGYSEPLRPGTKNFDIFFQQLLSESVTNYGTNVENFYLLCQGNSVFRDITQAHLKTLLKFWQHHDYIRIEGNDILLGGKGEQLFARKNFYELYSVFISIDQFEVLHHEAAIGVLDSWFVCTKSVGFLFSLGGRKWRTLNIDFDRRIVFVESASEAYPPAWKGGAFYNVEYYIAQIVLQILHGQEGDKFVEAESREAILLESFRCDGEYEILQSGEILIARYELHKFKIVTYAGTKFNEILSYLLQESDGFSTIDISYRRIIVKHKTNKLQDIQKVLSPWIENAKAGQILTEGEWARLIKKHLKVWEYSKYSPYIPEDLKLEYLISSLFHREEFFNFLSRSSIK